MGKVTFKTTTNSNNDFYSAIKKMLNEFGSGVNYSLDIMQTDDNKIVIQPMGGWNYHIDFNATPKEEKERRQFHIYNSYAGENYYVSLTLDQVRLLKWMFNNNVAYEDWEWEEMDKMEIEVI